MISPKVRVGDWVCIGGSDIDAYVLNINSETEIEAGYYQNNIKAIKESFVWDGNQWQFKNSGVSGSYLKGLEENIVKNGPYKN